MHNTGTVDTGPGDWSKKPARPTRPMTFHENRHFPERVGSNKPRGKPSEAESQSSARRARHNSPRCCLRNRQTDVQQSHRNGADSTPRRRKYSLNCSQLPCVERLDPVVHSFDCGCSCGCFLSWSLLLLLWLLRLLLWLLLLLLPPPPPMLLPLPLFSLPSPPPRPRGDRSLEEEGALLCLSAAVPGLDTGAAGGGRIRTTQRGPLFSNALAADPGPGPRTAGWGRAAGSGLLFFETLAAVPGPGLRAAAGEWAAGPGFLSFSPEPPSSTSTPPTPPFPPPHPSTPVPPLPLSPPPSPSPLPLLPPLLPPLPSPSPNRDPKP